MKKTGKRFFFGLCGGAFIVALLACILFPGASWAVFGDTREEIKYGFTREGNKITAKYIPQAKSTSVLVDFEIAGGNLAEVKGMDFELAKHPEVDNKDFKSALFTIEINEISPGAEVTVSIRSDFFSSSTEFWVFNQKLKSWMNSMAENVSQPNLFQELVINVKDGGSFDSDGVADGKVFLVGGPKDSFWGYALGTLFIRFFGIFIVLSILMVGMMLSGKIFQSIDKKKEIAASKTEPVAAKEQPVRGEKGISPDVAAAIAITLDMHFSALRPSISFDLSTPGLSSWTQHGRDKIMGERFLIYNR